MKSNHSFQWRLICAACITLWIAFSFSCCSDAQKPDNQRIAWRRIGIGGGGGQFSPAVSPHNENMAFITCDMGGSFVTLDGGESWRMFNLGSRVRFYVFDPVDPNVVYAQSYGLFKSKDKGLTWNLFYPNPSDVVCKVSQGDHAQLTIVLKDSTRRSVQALAIDPTQSKNLYAALSINGAIGLYTSTDGGGEWKKEKEFNHAISSIFIDPSSPADQRTLYVTWREGVYQRVNGQWQSFGTPHKNVKFNLFSGGYDANKKKYIIYTISGKGYFNQVDDTDLGFFMSEDGGKTWVSRHEGLLKYNIPENMNKVEFRSMATSAFNPATVYISYNRLKIHPDTTCIGMAKSEDFGKTWTLSWQDKFYSSNIEEDYVTSPNFVGGWMDEWGGPEWGENPFNIAVGPHHADICYGTDFGRTVKTSNGGETWHNVCSHQLPDGSWTSRGIEVTTCYDVAIDPFDEKHMLISTTDIGLQQSRNGGKGWHVISRVEKGIPRMWRNTTYWTVFDPEVKGRIWAVMARDHDLPRPKMWRGRQISSYQGGVVLSNDGGESWTNVSTSIGEAAMTHLLLDPKSNKNARTLYGCAFGKGVYKSIDGGLNWVQKNTNIEGKEPFAFRIERRESDGTLFLIVSRRGGRGPDGEGALYKSTDGAETWIKMSLPKDCNGPSDIVTTKKYPKRLVLSAWGNPTRGNFASDIGGGIFISDDEGVTWTQVMDKDQHIYAVSFDPRNGRYYACGFNASAYYSEDGAKTWTRIRGYNFKWGHRVTPDPRDPNLIFISTFGGGVWHGPAKGDPEATEDLLDRFETR